MKREIVVPIFNDEYKVIFTWGNAKQIEKALKRWGHVLAVESSDLESNRGRCFFTKACHPIIAMPRRPKTPTEIGTLAHEATHAVEFIYEYISEPFKGEIIAHSVGAIVRKVLTYDR